MTPQELRNSILQLAIQGKLVEQRPEEGTAEELFQQVQEEKQRLIKVGKIKKEKPLSKVTEAAIPFEIPESWLWVRLGHVLIIERGGSPRPIKDYLTESENGINWIKIGDTDKGSKYINKTKEKIIPEGMKKSRFVKKGDFLLSNSMSFGRPYILNLDGCIHDGWLVLHPVLDFFDKDFLYYFLSSPMAFHQFCSRVAGAVVNNLNSDKVALTLVPVPPLAEQKRIVAKIEELLPYIDRYEQAWSQLEQFNKKFPVDMQKSILQMAIQGELVEQRPEEGSAEELYQQVQAEKQRLVKEEKIKKEKALPEIAENEVPFEIPKSWKWVRLGTIALKLTDGSHNPPPNTGSGYPVISAKNIKNGSIIFDNVDRYTDEEGFEKENARTNITKGDIIMGIIGGSIGNAAVYEHDIKVIAQRSVAIIKLQLDTRFAFMLLKSPLVQNYLLAAASGSAQGGVYLGTLGNLALPLPPLLEQKRIVAKLEELLPLCEKLK